MSVKHRLDSWVKKFFTQKMQHFDVAVIGGGSGAKLGRPVAKLGLTVAYIEKAKLGGTCLNHGCIPSKMLIHAAEKVCEIEEASKFDIKMDLKFSVEKSKLVGRVNTSIDEDSSNIKPLLESQTGLRLFQASCKFVGPKMLHVGDEIIQADKMFIAVGCRARIPDIEGLKDTPFMTYKEALRLKEAPSSMIVIGGGYIAVEMGFFFSKTGTSVEFLVRSRMLNGEDHDIQDRFESLFKSNNKVSICMPTRVRYDPTQKLFTVTVNENGEIVQKFSESLLVATGVIPNTDTLDLEKAGIQTDANGFITVNSKLETNVDGCWAFGDVIGRNLFKHTANYEGEYLFDNIFGNSGQQDRILEYPPIPHAVFSSPQIGAVGLTERQANVQFGQDLIIGTSDYNETGMGNAMLDEHGFCKLIFRKSTGILVGAHIIGKESSNMIHMCIAFMKFKATIKDMLDTIYIHPALPEVVRNAVRDANSA